MKLEWETHGVAVNPWLEEFARTTVAFAVWHYARRVETVEIRFDRTVDLDRNESVRCTLTARTPDGPVSSGATGSDASEATREAADLLEVALHRPARTRSHEISRSLAA